MAFPVEVAAIQPRRVEYAVRAVGSVDAFETVQITARVAGVIERIKFQEGDMLKPGAVLVEIEPDRFRLAVDAARANLSKVQAARADAQAGLERREKVVSENPGLIPAEELETWRTKVRTASAELASARVAVESAELNLRDAVVRTPFPGKVERRDVQTGQYVQPGTVLATLVRRDPLLLRFKVPSEDATRLQNGMPARFTIQGDERQFSARITYVATAADAQSRMVDVTAEVDDERKDELKAGAFAEVTIPVGSSEQATVIPETAVRASEKGFISFVVDGDVAHERVVTVGMRTAEGMVEVRSGLQAGELLVVRGGEALKDGVKVRVDAPQAPAAAPAEPGPARIAP
jgi:RND family efflux transporter MFP subunit